MPRSSQTPDELLRFRLAMDMSGDAVYLVDRASMRFVDVNQTACTRMGYTREELLQMGPQDLLTASRDEIERLYDDVIAAGASGTTMESTARTRDGRESITELQRRAMRTEDGWIIVSIARDITQRKRLEQDLQESTEKLRLFTDNVPAMTASWDERLCCSFANKLFREYFSVAEGDVIGMHVRDILGEGVYRGSKPVSWKRCGGSRSRSWASASTPAGNRATSKSSCCRRSRTTAASWVASP